MSRNLSNTVSSINSTEDKKGEVYREKSEDNESGSNELGREEIEPASPADLEDAVIANEKTLPKASGDSKRPGLSRVASHITTHSLTDPGPPPDGGLKAWVQVACSWLSVLATWGWVNCFGTYS